MSNKTNIYVSHLSIYPIKSTQGINTSNSMVTTKGLKFDRDFVLTDLNGKFITGRTKSKLVLINSQLTNKGLILNAPSMPPLHVNYDDFSSNYNTIHVWKDPIHALHCSSKIDKWFSQYLATQCQLHYFGSKSTRSVANTNNPLSFADGYPLLGISQSSLEHLNNKLNDPINMAQFRPNITFEGTQPFDEDTWKKIKIGTVTFDVSKPCSRCIFTTVNEQTGGRSSDKEPMATLKSYRKHSDGEVYFGQNLTPLNEGEINVGDIVKVLETQQVLITIESE